MRSEAFEGDNRKAELLDASNDMDPIAGSVDVAIPSNELWDAFSRAHQWPRWNRCFYWVRNRVLRKGDFLVWAFQPIRTWYLYKMPAIAKIVDLRAGRYVTWQVAILPGMYALHTYSVQDLGSGRSRFSSWEKGYGWSFRLMRRFWIAHFAFVRDQSLAGARLLESVYAENGNLSPAAIAKGRRSPVFRAALLSLMVLLAMPILGGAWIYYKYLRLVHVGLAPGVEAVLGAGGNSLVVKDGSEVLLVDPKFPPGSWWLQKSVQKRFGRPTLLVNTHYHYDHTQGNVDYPEATIVANPIVPRLMLERDQEFWSKHSVSVPKKLVQNGEFRVGGQAFSILHFESGHTIGDSVVLLQREGQEIVATGDLVFNGFYPFFDLGKGGADITGIVHAVRSLAQQYPTSVFVPGHGPVARAGDLTAFADYLEDLYLKVQRAHEEGFSEARTVNEIKVARKSLLVSLHNGNLCLATGANNVRAIYRIVSRTNEALRTPCGLLGGDRPFP
jgi:glyoxylase-like metal-dependent hydrolase (beta-lactamase superfamily II)